jgi:hypothetical protein
MLPRAVRIIAWIWIVAGTVELLHALVVAGYSWRHSGRAAPRGYVNILTIFVGLGLLRRSDFWRKIAIVVCVLAFVVIPILAAAPLWGGSSDLSFLGWQVSFHDSPVAMTLVCIGGLVFYIYNYRVLTSPVVVACFQAETRQARETEGRQLR